MVYPAVYVEAVGTYAAFYNNNAHRRAVSIVYKTIIRPILFQFSAEQAHKLAEYVLSISPAWALVTPFIGNSDDRMRTTVAGLSLPNPVGLAAGLDKNCVGLSSLLYVGFGFVVGGTVTLAARSGNPKPRLLREPIQESLTNSLGFPGSGLEVVAHGLRKHRRLKSRIIVSVAGDIESEFVDIVSRLGPYVAAMEINVSSPNTAGLKVFQQPSRLSRLVEELVQVSDVPLLVKLPPWEGSTKSELNALGLAEAAISGGAKGLIIANTRPVNDVRLAVGKGGLSGRPLFTHTLRMVQDTVAALGRETSIVACGGVFNAEDAWRLIASGAAAIELYTSFIYEGPWLPRSINKGLIEMLDSSGVNSILDLRFSGTEPPTVK